MQLGIHEIEDLRRKNDKLDMLMSFCTDYSCSDLNTKKQKALSVSNCDAHLDLSGK